MDPVIKILDVDGFELGPARALVGGDRLNRPADLSG